MPIQVRLMLHEMRRGLVSVQVWKDMSSRSIEVATTRGERKGGQTGRIDKSPLAVLLPFLPCKCGIMVPVAGKPCRNQRRTRCGGVRRGDRIRSSSRCSAAGPDPWTTMTERRGKMTSDSADWVHAQNKSLCRTGAASGWHCFTFRTLSAKAVPASSHPGQLKLTPHQCSPIQGIQGALPSAVASCLPLLIGR